MNIANNNLAKGNNLNKQPLKQQQATATLKQNASVPLNMMQFNDENEPPQLFASETIVKQEQQEINKFEIFQEQQEQIVLQNEQKILIGGTISNKENDLFKSEEDEEDEDYEDEDEEDEEEDDDQEEESSEESEEDDDNSEPTEDDDELEEEEEGISRLNLVAQSDSDSGLSNASNSMDSMMDSSSTSQNFYSPMVLDDTIRFMSKIEEDKECNNFDFCDDDEEQCIETKKKLKAENILFNMIDYREDIMKYMRKIEQENRAKEDYMKKQMDITNSMRAILVDWLVEVAEEYKMNAETLYLACNFIDRFLSQMSVLRNKLQLVGTSCMYIAAKYEEIIPPGVNEFVYITDDTYTKRQVLRMEHLLLRIMDFHISVPTPNWFLTNFLKFIKLNTNFSTSSNSDLFQRIECLARYLSELTLLDCETFLKYLPSQIAASAVYLSLYTFNKPWTKQIADLCGYSQDLNELKPCINDMFAMFQRAAELPQKAIREKYKQAKYEHVSLVDPPKSLPAHLVIQSPQNSN